ncbi:MAG: imidazoleglycerol-phosphate dehydratase HisB [Clostridiales bacterium]|nr:imidazoleglycerol-phosphate dehydratase HisB [Clostridiales bacterium]
MRTSTINRVTAETDIHLSLTLDCQEPSEIDTGIGFLDHMLTLFAKHGFMQLKIKAKGDLEVDSHHTVEDIGIVLGDAIKEALGTKEGIRRYGTMTLPMDETLMLCAMDLSGRPYLNMDVTFTVPRLGTLDTEMIREFFYAVSVHAGMNLHFVQMAGSNNHHIAEAMFKAFGQAMDLAVTVDSRIQGVRSSKGSLE